MRKIRTFILFIILTALVGSMTNCQEDETFNTGTLSLHFTNHSSDMYANIFSIDNLSIPIDKIPIYNKNTGRVLNIGNYYIQVYSNNSSYSSIGFQIRAQNTTTIRWDDDNIAVLQ